MKQTNLSSVLGRWFVIAVPYTWLLVLFLIPFLIVLKISFAEQDIAIPPYTPWSPPTVTWGAWCCKLRI